MALGGGRPSHPPPPSTEGAIPRQGSIRGTGFRWWVPPQPPPLLDWMGRSGPPPSFISNPATPALMPKGPGRPHYSSRACGALPSQWGQPLRPRRPRRCVSRLPPCSPRFDSAVHFRGSRARDACSILFQAMRVLSVLVPGEGLPATFAPTGERTVSEGGPRPTPHGLPGKPLPSPTLSRAWWRRWGRCCLRRTWWRCSSSGLSSCGVLAASSTLREGPPAPRNAITIMSCSYAQCRCTYECMCTLLCMAQRCSQNLDG